MQIFWIIGFVNNFCQKEIDQLIKSILTSTHIMLT